jgi:hypothetical protein
MHIIPATLEHAFRVAEEMRECDRQEIRAASGSSPGVALLQSMQASAWKFAAVDEDGLAFAIFGLSESLPGIGSPWMLATDRFHQHERWALRATRGIVEDMQRRYPLLLNYVDARNARSIRWLKWAGFQIHPAMPFGVEGRPFHLFTKVSHV